jgi:hypothetical protein
LLLARNQMGQKNPVQVYLLVTEGTIEEKLLATRSAKHDLALAALDMDSDVKEVGLASGVEALKQRLEVLLGAKPHAPIDETEKQRQQQEAERLARRARVTEAGDQLLAAALTFLSEMIPQREPTNDTARMASDFKARLHECLERDEQGLSFAKISSESRGGEPNRVRLIAGSRKKADRVDAETLRLQDAPCQREICNRGANGGIGGAVAHFAGLKAGPCVAQPSRCHGAHEPTRGNRAPWARRRAPTNGTAPPSPWASAPSDRAELPEAGHQYCSKRYLPVLCSGQVCRFGVLRCRPLRFVLFYKGICFFQVRLVED